MDLTAIVVSFDDEQLLRKSLSSVREFYPELKIILIDGSPEYSECRAFIHKIEDKKVDKCLLNYNISHGAGLHVGIMLSPTDKVLCFDTDIVIKKPPVEDMLKLMDEETLMVGRVYEQPPTNWQVKLKREGNFKYVYPHFHIVNRPIYRKFLPYVHSGSPGNLHFLDVFNQGQEHRIKHFPIDDYVIHNQMGTSRKHPKEHKEGWLIQTNYFPANYGN